MTEGSKDRIVVVGLGYVGLPLAVALARGFDVTGFDIDARRVEELKRGSDRTREVDSETLATTGLALTSDRKDCAGADVYIVTVPTPVDSANQPDLGPVMRATETVAGLLDPACKPVIVYESTVYPGVTDDICGPIIERVSGLKRGQDFFLGYSPERINPGDRQHTVDRIVKVVAGENPAITERLADIYGKVTSAGVFRARSIRAAEAAKVIENAQRDINIAFINEITQIFSRMGISIHDVLEASATKWNFLRFQPGLVGGHCIGVDPYYLAHAATRLGHRAEVILSGRRVNDGMGFFIADRVADRLTQGLAPGKAARVLVLGLTFKENVPDLRNSKVIDLIDRLRQHGHEVSVHDPLADPAEALSAYGIELLPALDGAPPFDCVVAAVPHADYVRLAPDDLERLVAPHGLVVDIKGIWREMRTARARLTL